MCIRDSLLTPPGGGGPCPDGQRGGGGVPCALRRHRPGAVVGHRLPRASFPGAVGGRLVRAPRLLPGLACSSSVAYGPPSAYLPAEEVLPHQQLSHRHAAGKLTK
eukprot:88040-Prorocentrum_minimum.AAC.1